MSNTGRGKGKGWRGRRRKGKGEGGCKGKGKGASGEKGMEVGGEREEIREERNDQGREGLQTRTFVEDISTTCRSRSAMCSARARQLPQPRSSLE